MFSLSDFELIKDKCPDDLEELLRMLDVTRPIDWNILLAKPRTFDEYITSHVCELINKSPSELEGYSMLLGAAGIQYSFTETPNELLAKIVENRQAVKSAITARPVQEEIPAQPKPKYVNEFTVRTLLFRDIKANLLKEIDALISQLQGAGIIKPPHASQLKAGQKPSCFLEKYEYSEAVKKFHELIVFANSIPDKVFITDDVDSKTFSEEDFIDAVIQDYQYVPVKISSRRVQNQPQPLPQPKPINPQQGHLFSENEAEKMLRVLEKIHTIRRRI